MTTPPPIKTGDKIGIVTPSGKIGIGDLDNAIDCFEGWGLRVVTSPNVYSFHNQFGGTDRERASDLQSMLDDPGIKAVICSRGGYGTLRIIDHIDFSRFVSNPKWVVGYSDITVLHSHINKSCGIETIHGPMAAELSPSRKNPVSLESLDLLREALTGNLIYRNYAPHPLSRDGQAEGILTGGNLSVICSLLGSPSMYDLSGAILFIEDVGEYLYHIDRMMVALRRSGVLAGIGGLVVGSMTDMNDNRVPFGKTAAEIVAEAVGDYGYPVFFGFPAGHQHENHPLILGRKVVVSVSGNTGSLTYVDQDS